jgi:hypothetical protein
MMAGMFTPEGSGFPPLTERWLLSLLGGAIPTEPRTTCGACPMVAGDDLPSERFDPRTKCCTFFPNLASHQVGGLLLDDDPGMAHGKALVAERVREGAGVSPYGLGRPEIFVRLYRMEASFGHARGLRCPYYIDADGGMCGVWRHRESTCAMWFCKHERGRVGHTFWDAVRALMTLVERRLAVVIGLELGIDRGALIALENTPFELSRAEHPDHYAALWGPWAGREAEYFMECARRVAPLSWDEVRARCGGIIDDEVQAVEAMLRHLHDTELPPTAQLVRHEQLGADRTRVRLRTFSSFDPLDVPVAVAHALAYFDGGPIARAVERAAAEGVELDEPLVRKLLDFEVLEP